jgi:hypothetical protein
MSGYADSYEWDRELSGFTHEQLMHWSITIQKICGFVYEKLGNPANIKWMAEVKHPQFFGMTLNQIRNTWDMRKLDEFADLLLAGKIPCG